MLCQQNFIIKQFAHLSSLIPRILIIIPRKFKWPSSHTTDFSGSQKSVQLTFGEARISRSSLPHHAS
jgi:hypothetical protein